MYLRLCLRLCLTFCVCIGLTEPSLADPLDAARTARAALDAAKSDLNRATGPQARLRALSRGVRGYEAALIALSAAHRDLAEAEAVLRGELASKQADIARTLHGLQSIERVPGALRVIHPEGAVAAARAAMILTDVLPALEKDARQIRTRHDHLTRLIAARAEARANLDQGVETLGAARDSLRAALTAPNRQAIVATDQSALAETLGGTADTLSALIAGLDSLPASGPAPDALVLPGSLDLPVAGKVIRRFGEADAAGIARPGIVIQTLAGALVTAPSPARVRYAGPFLDRGAVVVLEPEPGFLIALNGLGVPFVTTGQAVNRGAPLGVMGGAHTETEEFLIANSEGDSAFLSESLYVEFRQRGIETDPMQWFAPEDGEER